MALGAVQAVTAAGITPNWQTPAATENIQGGASLRLHVKNTGGTSGTATPQDPGSTPAGSVATNAAVTIPATTGEKVIFLPAALTNGSTGVIQVTFAGGTLSAYVVFD
jgi:hypothetical protein